MNIWDPFDPITYGLHVAFGVITVVSAVVVYASKKGSKRHILAGRIFAASMTIAAVTALVFSIAYVPAPNAMVSAIITLYAISTGVLALRRQAGLTLLFEKAASVIALILAALPIIFLLNFDKMPGVEGMSYGDFAMIVAIFIGPFSILAAILFFFDIKFFRASKEEQAERRIGRHLTRMSVAATEIIRAVGATFGNVLGPFVLVTYIGPFLLLAFIVFYYRKRAKAIALERAAPS